MKKAILLISLIALVVITLLVLKEKPDNTNNTIVNKVKRNSSNKIDIQPTLKQKQINIIEVDSVKKQGSLNVIFDIYDSQYRYNPVRDISFSITDNPKILEVKKGNGPVLVLSNTSSNVNEILLSLEMESNRKTSLKIYFKPDAASKYINKYSYVKAINKGQNKINLVMPANYINNGLRIDFVSNSGTYKINKFKIYSK